MLYSIQFLHQITTPDGRLAAFRSCIVSNFYIKSQLLVLKYEEILCCIVSNFYIKSQLSFLLTT